MSSNSIGFMGSKFLKFIRYNLVYIVFISFVFLAYFYIFDYTIHTKYRIEDLNKTNDNNATCYITNNDLAGVSQPSDDSDATNEYEDFLRLYNNDHGNYNTYNTVYEFNDVIVHRFKKVFQNLFDSKLFSPPGIGFTLIYIIPSHIRKQINGEEYYILERKMRI